MKINNKEFKDWTYNDLEVLLGNDVYRENSVIDYKISFSQLECTDKNLKRKNKLNLEMMSVLSQMRRVGICFMALVKTLVWQGC